MQKQLWVYLTAEDEAELLNRLTAEQSLKIVRGRWIQGDLETLLRSPEQVPARDLSDRTHYLQLLHPTASQKFVTHPVPEGPLAGCLRVDEVRSEVMTLVRPEPDEQGLAPSRLFANTHAWFGGEREKKSHAFARWVASTMALVEESYGPTSFDWLRVAPHARAWAEQGGKLHYLFREVALQAPAQKPLTPHRRSIG